MLKNKNKPEITETSEATFLSPQNINLKFNYHYILFSTIWFVVVREHF